MRRIIPPDSSRRFCILPVIQSHEFQQGLGFFMGLSAGKIEITGKDLQILQNV